MTFLKQRFTVIALLVLAGAALVYGAVTWTRSSTPSEAQAAPAAEPSEHAGHGGGTAASADAAPEPGGAVELTDAEQKAIGVETVEVRRRKLESALVTLGRVEESETGLTTISARVGGRIDKLYLDFTGASVRRGQPVALIYSPEIASAAEEYQLALESARRLGAEARPDALGQANDLVAASGRRLELWGLSAQQIQEIAKADAAPIQITVHSTVSGTVMERKVTEGQYVREGDVLYTLSDLSAVWVKADVYESDLPQVRVGQAAEITGEALPAKLRGRVDFIEPVLDPQTRTVAVRIQVANPALRLRPAMFVNVRLEGHATTESLAVPRSAVLDTGTRKIVYVASGGGVFEPRPVEVGAPTEEFYPLRSGVREGERVVTHGSFLIDSQTRLTGGMAGMFGGSKEFANHSAPAAAAEKFRVTLQAPPEPAGGRPADFRASVTGPDGRAVSDAKVTLTLVMPAMPSMGMPEMRQSGGLKWDGRQYSGSMTVPTAGSWNVTVEASRGGQRLATYRTTLRAK